MTKTLERMPTKWLYVSWTVILTIGIVLCAYGIQANSNQDAEDSRKADAAQALAFCHALSDNNQAIRDILSLLSVDSKVTDDMTPSQKESIRIANERRKGYRLISETLFPVATCSDGYKATSRQAQLAPMLTIPPGTTTTSTTPGG